MDALKNFSPPRTAVAALLLAAALTGCNTKPPAADDAALTAAAQARISADQNLSGQPIQASVTNGVATLNGSVSSDTARSIANQDVAQITGIRTVVDNLYVNNQTAQNQTGQNQTGQAPPAAATPRQAPLPAQRVRKPSAMMSSRAPAPVERDAPPALPAPPQNSAPPVAQMQQSPPPPPPPPAPTVHNITLAAGETIPVRITQTLDSATTQTGDKFTGAVASDIVADGLVVLPQGTPVTGHVDAAQDAAHFKGSALLTISLTAINRRGDHIEVATDPYTKQGEGRGKNTAEKIGGGAAVGAILGGILGGGKGAAIGSVAGGGVGAGAQGVTRGQQVQIPSETVVRFKLSDPIIVHVTTGPATSGTSSPSLERHTDQ